MNKKTYSAGIMAQAFWFNEFKQYLNLVKNGYNTDEIKKTVSLFNVGRTSKAEKMATVLASWNDFLIDGINPTDDMIIKINMRKEIQGSLDRLVSQNYVARNGDTYTFLTDDEQDIK